MHRGGPILGFQVTSQKYIFSNMHPMMMQTIYVITKGHIKI